MFISEETQCDLMDELYEKTHHWPTVYEQIEDLVKKELEVEKYSSISSNYRCIFLYHVMKKEINLPDFKQILTSIFNIVDKDNTFNVGFTFDRFFNYRGTDITYKGYFQPHLFEDPIKPRIWDHIYFTFHDWDETGLILNKKNLPYLQAIIEQAPEKHIGVMYEGRLPSLVETYMYLGKTHEILPVLQSIKQNPAFDKDGQAEHRSFTGVLMSYLFHLSYEEKIANPCEKMKIALEQIKEVYPNFEEIIAAGLISEKNRYDGKDKITINSDYLRVNGVIGLQKTVKNLNIAYHNIYAKIAENHDIHSDNPKSHKAFSNLFTELSSTISVYMDEPFDFDLTQMDISRNYVENYIYLKVLETQIEKGNAIKIPADYEEYLMHYPDSKMADKFFLIFDNDAIKFKSYIKGYLQYTKLENSLPINEEKEIKKTGMKI